MVNKDVAMQTIRLTCSVCGRWCQIITPYRKPMLCCGKEMTEKRRK